jgi:hypothetical protein
MRPNRERRDFSDNSWVGKLQPWVEVMLANCRDIWERDYAHLAPHKKMKKRDAFEEWLYCKKEENTVTDEFRGHSIAGSAIPPPRGVSLAESARYRRSLPYPATLGPRSIRLPNNILPMRASL